ncbi:hypothetical protein ACW4TU_41555 [Streptomyces sp. QTS52]
MPPRRLAEEAPPVDGHGDPLEDRGQRVRNGVVRVVRVGGAISPNE